MEVRILLNRSKDGSDEEIKFFNNGSSVYTFGYDDLGGNMRLGTSNVDTNVIFGVKFQWNKWFFNFNWFIWFSDF